MSDLAPFIQHLKRGIRLSDVVGQYVDLETNGGTTMGLRPFHGEKTPSFHVHDDTGFYYCFGCHEGGDAFSFLMKIEGLSFGEAVRAAARDCGIAVPETGGGESGVAEPLIEANELLAERYTAELQRAGNPGVAYLAERGLDAATIERFRIGYAPESWDFAVRVLRERTREQGMGPVVGMPVVFTSLLGHGELFSTTSGFAEVGLGLSQTPQVWIDHQVLNLGGEIHYRWDVVEQLLFARTR